jgi:lipid II:glycine glycyltransferase (peptidoglycan interpeptide bridge formation enzyme)
VDVSRHPDEILAAMRPSTRYNTRVGRRKGIVVREGDGADVPAYHRMLRATAERQSFSAFPAAYYVQMWRILAPGGHIRLTFAECDGEPIAGQLAIVFGRTVVNKLSVWSGREGGRRPNEALQWDTITWAHAAGQERYDLEGIRVEAARALLAGDPLPDRFKDTVTSYKLGFGGAVVVRPEPSLLVSNRALDVAIRRLYPLVQQRGWAKRLQRRIRQGAAGPGRRTEAAGP